MKNIIARKNDVPSLRERRSIFDEIFGKDILSEFFEGRLSPAISQQHSSGSLDTYEDEKNYYAEIDVPGFTKEEINLFFNDGMLEISGEKNSESNDASNKSYSRQERYHSSFARQIRINNVDESKIEAELKDGVLKITMPKLEERILPPAKKINIK